MNIRVTGLFGLLVFAATFIISMASHAQVDSAWLRSWNAASENRPAVLTSSGRIAEESEPGIPMLINGQVLSPDGTAASGVLVHAYHRDSKGFEFKANDKSPPTWKLQGWAVTDAAGRFEFKTIRPAPDHLGREAAHIHFTLESTKFGRQWAPKVFLSDDPLVTKEQRQRSTEAAEFGGVIEVQTVNGVQNIDVKFRLKSTADF